MRYGSKAPEIQSLPGLLASLGKEGLNVDTHRNVDLTPETEGYPGLEHGKRLHLESGDASPRPQTAWQITARFTRSYCHYYV